MKKLLPLIVALKFFSISLIGQSVVVAPSYSSFSFDEMATPLIIATEMHRQAESQINNLKLYIVDVLSKDIDERLKNELNNEYSRLRRLSENLNRNGISQSIINELRSIYNDTNSHIVSFNSRVEQRQREYEREQRRIAEEQKRIAEEQERQRKIEESQPKVWSGTGFALNNGYLVTNWHVADEAQTIHVYGVRGDFKKKYIAEVVTRDKINDLAILKISGNGFPGFGTVPYIVKTSTAEVAEDVWVLGFPLTMIMGDEIKYTDGRISALSGFDGDVSMYQISAPIQSGNSGGPVFDDNGNVIGIACAGIDNRIAQNANYAVKSSYLKYLVETMRVDNVLPTNSLMDNYALRKDKVKAIRDFVFYIECSDMGTTSDNTASTSISSTPNTSQKQVSVNEKQEAERLMQLSYEKCRKNDFLGAYSDIIESIKLYPTAESHFLRAGLAQNFYFDTDIDNVIESYKYCIEHEYKLEESYYGLAECFHAQCRYNEAIDMCNKVLLENKKNISALYGRAICKMKNGDDQSSIADYMRAVKYEGIVDFDYGTIYNNIADAYLRLGNLDMAEKYIKEALKRNHLEWYIWGTEGELAYKKGDYNRCIYSLNNAITIDNKCADAYYYRALAKVKIGNHSGAYNDMEILNTIDRPVPKWKFDCVYNEWEKQKKEDSVKANTLKNSIDMSKVDFENLTEDEKIISCPKIISKSADISVKAVEFNSEYTALHFIVLFQEFSGRKNYWVMKDAYIIDKYTSDTLFLLKAENCSIWPETTPAKNGETEFVLYFPAINKNCKEIDFVEPSSNQNSKSWFAKGIRVGETDGILSWEDVFVTDEELAVQDMVYVKTIKKKCAYGAKNSCVNSIRKEAAKENCRVVLITGVNDAEWSTTLTAKLYR